MAAEKLYTLVVRSYFRFMPDDVNTDDHLVFNDLDVLMKRADSMQSNVMVKPIRIEESYFRKNQLSCKRVIRDFLKEQEEQEEEEEK